MVADSLQYCQPSEVVDTIAHVTEEESSAYIPYWNHPLITLYIQRYRVTVPCICPIVCLYLPLGWVQYIGHLRLREGL